MVATIIKRGSHFFAAYSVGGWNQSTIRVDISQLAEIVEQPSSKRKLEIYTDGNDDYVVVLPEYFHKDSLCYGQKVKSKNGEKIYPAIRRKVYGNPDREAIETNAVECVNSVMRERIPYLVRRSRNHAKRRRALDRALGLFQFHWNFMHCIKKKLTPAILERQATKVWTWGNLFHAKLRYTN